MRERALPPPVSAALSQLEAAGYRAYLVGGCVRDMLRGVAPADFDLTTDAMPDEIKRVFSDCRTVDTGLRHGTVTVLFEGVSMEITTHRTEDTYSDGRHPDRVRFVPHLQDDLARRDFTMNAVACDGRGTLTDPFGGQEDIAEGRIRCVGDPARRFEEDALRILRALRFSAQLGFSVEEATERALVSQRLLLGRVSAERIAAELTGMLCGNHADAVLTRYLDVLRVPLPELSSLEGGGALAYAARAVSAAPPVPVLRLSAFLCRTGFEETEALLRRLRFSRAEATAVLTLTKWREADLPPARPALRRVLNRLGGDMLRDLFALRRALAAAGGDGGALRRLEEAGQMAADILRENDCFTFSTLALKGDDLEPLGFAPGPALGAALQALLEQVMDGTLPNTRDALLSEAARLRDARLSGEPRLP